MIHVLNIWCCERELEDCLHSSTVSRFSLSNSFSFWLSHFCCAINACNLVYSLYCYNYSSVHCTVHVAIVNANFPFYFRQRNMISFKRLRLSKVELNTLLESSERRCNELETEVAVFLTIFPDRCDPPRN